MDGGSPGCDVRPSIRTADADRLALIDAASNRAGTSADSATVTAATANKIAPSLKV